AEVELADQLEDLGELVEEPHVDQRILGPAVDQVDVDPEPTPGLHVELDDAGEDIATFDHSEAISTIDRPHPHARRGRLHPHACSTTLPAGSPPILRALRRAYNSPRGDRSPKPPTRAGTRTGRRPLVSRDLIEGNQSSRHASKRSGGGIEMPILRYFPVL